MPHRPHRPKSAARNMRLHLLRLTPLTLMIVTVVTIVAVAVSARIWLASASRSGQQLAVVTPAAPSYVRRISLWPELQHLLAPLGSRLTTPGMERLTLIGTLSRPNAAKNNLPSKLVLEFPNNLRLEEQDGAKLNVVLFNGQAITRPGDTAKSSDEADVESLVFDGVEHFFLSQMQGQATRFIGSRYRLDDGTAKNYTGPFYDIYEVSDQVTTGINQSRQQTKLYYFNSDTLLLEKVRYQTNRSGPVVNAEVQFSGWQKMNGQFLPGRITQLENGTTMLDFKVVSAALSPRANDGIFDR